jgi:mannose-1-phosphate guanylyltransferase
MQKWLGCGNAVIEKMSAAMIEKFDKYWSDIQEFMALATILDPRM